MCSVQYKIFWLDYWVPTLQGVTDIWHIQKSVGRARFVLTIRKPWSQDTGSCLFALVYGAEVSGEGGFWFHDYTSVYF